MSASLDIIAANTRPRCNCDTDPLRAARGVMTALVMATPFWIGVGILVSRFWG